MKFAIAFIAATVLAAAAPVQAQQLSNTTNPDLQFAARAASGGHAEVELGRLALSKSKRDDVHHFAQRMIDDHSKVNQQLASLATHQHLRLPKQAMGEDADTVKRLSALSGAEFDRAYAAAMVQDHQKDIRDFETESAHGGVPQFKTLATVTGPVLLEHLKMAEDLQRAVGEEKAQLPQERSSGRH
jgi:putative membrane protein